MDPDMNKYDLNHRVVHHPTMSDAEWEDAYWSAWEWFYSPEHMETIMRRAAACGLSVGKVMFMMLWFFFSIRYDRVHPLESGYFRLKFRRDRRPTMPARAPLVFYPRYAWETVRSHFWMGYWILKMNRVRWRIKADAGAQAVHRPFPLQAGGRRVRRAVAVHRDARWPRRRRQEAAGGGRTRRRARRRLQRPCRSGTASSSRDAALSLSKGGRGAPSVASRFDKLTTRVGASRSPRGRARRYWGDAARLLWAAIWRTRSGTLSARPISVATRLGEITSTEAIPSSRRSHARIGARP